MIKAPIILKTDTNSIEDVEHLRKHNNVWKEVDLYEKQLLELLEIRFPNKNEREKQKSSFLKQKSSFLKQKSSDESVWVYYPWSGVLLHTVGSDELFELRTNRNQNLITKDEQTKLRMSTVGVAGMSVGAGIAIGIEYAGIASSIKLADFDTLETANLN